VDWAIFADACRAYQKRHPEEKERGALDEQGNHAGLA